LGRLAGEVALVTGSTSGLGAEIARSFAAEGARVVVTGRSEERGARVVDEIRASGAEAHFAAADLADAASAAALVSAAREHFGSLTVLVNNAVGAAAPFADAAAGDVAPEVWDAKLRVDLIAPGLLIRAAIPEMMRAGHGSIVNISSRTALRATPRVAVYTAAKGGLEALARSVATDYAKHGIRCNTVRPGYIWHERRDAEITAERRARVEAMHLTRVPNARDVALAALFFASRESETITGAVLPVDGGSSIARAGSFG
jgi:NAD(P)-dependent dehydrogenase (short-subunit alcohol dehydrogenase family)